MNRIKKKIKRRQLYFFHAKISMIWLEWLRNPIKANCCQTVAEKYTQYKVLLWNMNNDDVNIFFAIWFYEWWFDGILILINQSYIFVFSVFSVVCFFCFPKYRRTKKRCLLLFSKMFLSITIISSFKTRTKLGPKTQY